MDSFFPLALVDRNKLDSDIRNSPSYLICRKKFEDLIRPGCNKRC